MKEIIEIINESKLIKGGFHLTKTKDKIRVYKSSKLLYTLKIRGDSQAILENSKQEIVGCAPKMTIRIVGKNHFMVIAYDNENVDRGWADETKLHGEWFL